MSVDGEAIDFSEGSPDLRKPKKSGSAAFARPITSGKKLTSSSVRKHSDFADNLSLSDSFDQPGTNRNLLSADRVYDGGKPTGKESSLDRIER